VGALVGRTLAAGDEEQQTRQTRRYLRKPRLRLFRKQPAWAHRREIMAEAGEQIRSDPSDNKCRGRDIYCPRAPLSQTVRATSAFHPFLIFDWASQNRWMEAQQP
jgi:hypothetical protein